MMMMMMRVLFLLLLKNASTIIVIHARFGRQRGHANDRHRKVTNSWESVTTVLPFGSEIDSDLNDPKTKEDALIALEPS